MTADDVVEALRDARFLASTEAHLQLGVRDLLQADFPNKFAREYGGFGRRDRPDFFCEEFGIVVEVKTGTSGGTAPKAFAQLQRYAERPEVRAIVFATTSRRVASRLGDVIGGKPIARVVLRTGF